MGARNSNMPAICRGGEIGRHATLRWWWAKALAGSSPVLGTITESQEDSGEPANLVFAGFFLAYFVFNALYCPNKTQ